jgi:hypothetical protein
MARDALATLTTEVAQAAAHFEEQFSVPLLLVLIDTLIAGAAYAKVGRRERRRISTKDHVGALEIVGARRRAQVLGLDHLGKAVETGTRGSSGKEGHADVVLAILADRELADTVTTVRKLRDGTAGLELPFAAKSIEVGTDPDGDPVRYLLMLRTSLPTWRSAMTFRPGVSGNPHGNRHRTPHLLNQEFMQALLLHFRQHGKKAIENTRSSTAIRSSTSRSKP